MITVPGRNELCPCMSGKKYKKCCGETDLWLNLKKQGVSYLNEHFYLNKLLEDERFKLFYMSERRKINKTVLCLKSDVSLYSSASYGRFGNETYTISSKYDQVPIQESIHIAHEYQHLVLHSKGHKAVKLSDESLNGRNRTHKMLNDMIYDPLVNQSLIEYGYDIKRYLELSDSVQLGVPNTGDNELAVKTLYVKRILDYQNLNPNIQEDDIEFVKWAKKDYPQVINDSKGILKIIDNYSLEDPLQSEVALNDIIQYLGFEEMLELEVL